MTQAFHDGIVNYRVVCDNKIFSSTDTQSPCIYRGGILSTLPHKIAFQLKNKYFTECNIDLRSEEEVVSANSFEALASNGIKRIHIPLQDDIKIFRKIRAPTNKDYYKYYCHLLINNSSEIIHCLKFIANSKYKRFFINCYAGKDRTQIIIMLILEILHIDQDIIINDYVESGKCLLKNVKIFEKNWLKRKMTKDEYLPRLQPQHETLKLLYTFINKKHGSFCALLNSWGLESVESAKIKNKFLTYISGENN